MKRIAWLSLCLVLCLLPLAVAAQDFDYPDQVSLNIGLDISYCQAFKIALIATLNYNQTGHGVVPGIGLQAGAAIGLHDFRHVYLEPRLDVYAGLFNVGLDCPLVFRPEGTSLALMPYVGLNLALAMYARLGYLLRLAGPDEPGFMFGVGYYPVHFLLHSEVP